MAHLSTTEQAAITAVAKHCAGTWQVDEGALMVDGRRIALDVLILARHGSASTTLPRLREDRVAQRVLRDLEIAVGGHAHGRAVIVTLGAPIKVPSQLVAALAEQLRRQLGSRATETSATETDVALDLLGNRVRYHVLRDGSAWTSPVNGFVFSGDPSPGELAAAMGALRDQITATAKRRTRQRSIGDRWLVMVGDELIADGRTYRRCLSRLSVPAAYAKILLVSAGKRVETLIG